MGIVCHFLAVLLLLEINIHPNKLYTKNFSLLSTCELYPISNLERTHFIVEIGFKLLFRRHVLVRAAVSLTTLQSDNY